jgi:hypothetical protein
MATHFVRGLHWGDRTGQEIWRVDEEAITRIDVFDASGLQKFRRPNGEDLQATLHRIAPNGDWHPLDLEPSAYYPRMARPSAIYERGPGVNPDVRENFTHYRARSTGQLHAFVQELEQICRVLHPQGRNLKAYGHATRNLLILASTEVEVHWRTILTDNHYKDGKDKNQLYTADYYHLSDAMRLGQYVVSLNYYPWLPTFSPFQDWNGDRTSKSLPWYEAYNKVKHDREGHFSAATLERALMAVTACFVMLCAQYGWDFALRGDEAERAFFKLVQGPQWAPSEIYTPPYGENYRPRNYPFPSK